MKKGLKILVIGSSSGLGDAVVRQLMEETEQCVFYCVSRTNKNKTSLESKSVQGNHQLHFLNADLNERDLYKKELESWLKDKPIDVVFYNAGVLVNEPIISTSLNQIDTTYNTNVFGFISTIQVVYSKLRESDAAQVLVSSSMGGFAGSVKFPGLSAYSSSKAAISNLVEVLAEEHKADGIIYNALSFGAINTDMLNQAFPDYTCDVSPKEMASFVVQFLLGPRLFNGKNIPVSITTP